MSSRYTAAWTSQVLGYPAAALAISVPPYTGSPSEDGVSGIAVGAAVAAGTLVAAGAASGAVVAAGAAVASGWAASPHAVKANKAMVKAAKTTKCSRRVLRIAMALLWYLKIFSSR